MSLQGKGASGHCGAQVCRGAQQRRGQCAPSPVPCHRETLAGARTQGLRRRTEWGQASQSCDDPSPPRAVLQQSRGAGRRGLGTTGQPRGPESRHSCPVISPSGRATRWQKRVYENISRGHPLSSALSNSRTTQPETGFEKASRFLPTVKATRWGRAVMAPQVPQGTRDCQASRATRCSNADASRAGDTADA